jgi:hypothetical protein
VLSARRRVVTLVEEHVRERVPHLARRAERDGVVAIGEDAPTATKRSIELLREADAEALHSTRQRGATRGLDEEVEVVGLRAPLDDPQADAAARRGERTHEHPHPELRSQAGQITPDPQRHVHRRPPIEPGTRRVHHPHATDASVFARAPRPRSRATSSRKRQRRLQFTRHHR